MAFGYYDSTSATSTAWVAWNDQWQTTATITTTTTNATSDTTWYTWTQDTSDATWTQWVTVDGGTATVTYNTYGSQVSDEDIAAERARVQAAADARMAERLEAVKKAKALLHSLLNEKQREQLERQRFFEFVSQTGRRMRMKHGHSRNIDVLNEEGKRVQTLCAHPLNHDLVEEDHMVAQLLTLRHNEEAFMRVANVS